MEYTINERDGEYYDILLILKILMVSVSSIIFVNNKFFATAVIVLEIAILVYNILVGKFADYLGNYILFCGLSMEFSGTIESEAIYSFKEFRIFGVNLGVVSLLPCLLFFIFHSKRVCINKKKSFDMFCLRYLNILFISVLVGLVMIALNDNNVAILNPLGILIKQAYMRGVQPILLIMGFYVLFNYYSQGINRVGLYLEAALIGTVICMIISFLSGIHGEYGGVDILVSSVNSRWIPLMLLFPLYDKYKNKKYIFVMGIIGTMLVLMYNATGKTIAVIGLIPIIYIYFFYKKKKMIKFASALLILPMIIIISIPIAQYLISNSILFHSKLNQLISMISFFGGRNNAHNVAASPRVRVYELMNIMEEYKKKPFLLPLGKGLVGTVHGGYLTYTPGGYTDAEWTNDLFYGMHESFSKLLLSNGLYGGWFLIHYILVAVKRITISPWTVIGVYWLFVSFGFSITMTAMGMSCLLYGLNDIDTEIKKGKRHV